LLLQKTYHANGKLLLTGEYLVLHGATAIALPLKLGQQMTVSEGNDADLLHWQAFYNEKIWFSCDLSSTDFSVIQTSHPEKAETLSHLFKTIKKLNPEFAPAPGTRFETALEANPEWGFGSSSTLVSLLSQMAKVDPFVLNELVFNGSGFDIACATADGPFYYIRNKEMGPVKLNYPFSDQLFLVYSGNKMKTAGAVSSFLKNRAPSVQLIQDVSILSEEFALCRDQDEFNLLIRQHEAIISNAIGQLPVKSMYFTHFKGEIKSLGAWGGDFFLVSTPLPISEVTKYFGNKGLNTLFKWDDLILKRK
jgi:mevalonate kinase